MSTKFATGGDKLLLIVSLLGSMLMGCTGTLIAFIWSGNINAVNVAGASKDQSVDYTPILFTLGAGGILGLSEFIKMSTFNIFADNISYNMKLRYFRAALEKDATYYDKNNQNEMSSKISKECSSV